MSSNTIRISELPVAVMVEQDDLVPIVQDGVTKRATVADIQAASTVGNQSFITVNTEPATPQSRKLTTTGPNLLLTDNGPLSTLNISITGFLGSLGSVAGSGIIVNNGGAAVTRALVPPAAGLTITNPDGTTGNPTFALANDLAAVEGLGTTGLAARIGVDTWDTRALVPPTAGITIANPGGVAGNPTFALANDLAALEGLNGPGYAAHIATDTWATRSLVAPAAGITIANPDGVAGNSVFALANDLAALEGLTGTGYAVRSAADTWVQRSVVGTANEIGTTNPDGVAGNTIVFLPATLTFTGKTVTGGTFTGGTSSPTSLTVKDNAFTVQDDIDPTKQFQFQASGIAVATTRTYNAPNENGDLVLLSTATALGILLG